MEMVWLAKEALNFSNMTFGQAFVAYGVKFIACMIVAFAGIKVGIMLRKRKNSTNEE